LLHEIRNLCRPASRAALSEIKARQQLSIQQIGEALAASGMSALDEKARALGLSRSTAWTVLKGGHKATGLTASVVSRILAALLQSISGSTIASLIGLRQETQRGGWVSRGEVTS